MDLFTVLLWTSRFAAGLGGLYGLWTILVAISSFGPLNPVVRRGTKVNRFAIITCAKNEEQVIDQLIGSLHRLDYPREAFEVFVVADNCDDATAEVSRQAGATVYERFDAAKRGKGYALNWFFEQFLPERRDDFDAVVIFDADNLVHRDFLNAMNAELSVGHTLAAGYRVGKNPSSSVTAGLSSMFWLMQSRYFYHPRARRGLPVGSIGGTGFMFSLTILGEEGWHTQTIAEDIEFTLNAIANRHFAAYARGAIFYDEQPLKFWQSVTQRYRWAVGAMQCTALCTPKLFRAIRGGYRRAIDAFIFSMGIYLATIAGVLGAINMTLEVIAGNGQWVLTQLITMTVVAYLIIAVLCWLAVELEDKSWPGDWGSILLFPFFALSWSMVNTVALFWRDTTWRDIPHTVRASIEDVEHSVRIRQPEPTKADREVLPQGED